MILFHGSNVTVKEPEILTNGYYKDFGYGFYCTLFEKQAKRWALTKKKNHIVNQYEYTENVELKIKVFEKMTDEWLEFVVNCRRGIKHDYDIVEGAMADDTIWDYIEDYMAEKISKAAFWELVKFKYPTHQIVFCTEDALKTLKFEGAIHYDKPIFEDEEITDNDLYFLCYMIERVARKLHQRNKYVVNHVEKDEWERLISLANVLHCENPLKMEEEWIEEYHLVKGDFDITKVDSELVDEIPYPTQMGKVYMRLILSTLQSEEDYIDGLIRVYNDEICETIDNYNCSAYYEPSYVITRAYNEGGF